MVLHQLLPRYLSAIAYAKMSPLLPFNWDGEKAKFVPQTPKHARLKCVLTQGFFVLFFLTSGRFILNDLDSGTFGSRALSLLMIFAFGMMYLMVSFPYTNDNLFAIPNAFLSFEVSEDEKGERERKAKWFLFVDFLLALTPVFQFCCSAFLLLLVIRRVSRAPFMGYLFQPFCLNIPEWYCHAGHAVLLLYQLWVWNWIYTMVMYQIIFNMQTPILLLFRYIKNCIR